MTGSSVGIVHMPFTGKANVNNTSNVIGSGVGAKSRFVRNALKKRANNKADGTPCKICN